MAPKSTTMSFEGKDPRKNIRVIEDAILAGVHDGVTEITLFTKGRAQANLTDRQKVDEGTLRQSITAEVANRGKSIVGKVFPAAKHGIWVEYGRKGRKSSPAGTNNPHAGKAAFPPINVIREWVRRNNSEFRVSGVTKSGRTRKPKDQDLDNAAFLIARKIADEGIQPTPYLRPAYELARPRTRKTVANHVAARIRRFRGTK